MGDENVLTLLELARELKVSRRTIMTRLANGTFPIPTLPALDKKHRWSRQAVMRYLEGHADRPVSWRRRRA